MVIRQAPLADRDRGATAVEYALIIAGIAVVIVAAVLVLGRTLDDTYTTAGQALAGDVQGNGGGEVQSPPAAFSVVWQQPGGNALSASWSAVEGSSPITFTIVYVGAACASNPNWATASVTGASVDVSPGAATSGSLGNGRRCATVRATNSEGTTYASNP